MSDKLQMYNLRNYDILLSEKTGIWAQPLIIHLFVYFSGDVRFFRLKEETLFRREGNKLL